MAEAQLQIRLLGPLEISLEGGEPLGFETSKACALLAFLAAEWARPHSRESIAEMLWPDRPQAAALANLRHTLASLRTTLGEPFSQGGEGSALRVTNQTLQLKPDAKVRIDLVDFESHMDAAEKARAGPETAAHCRSAARLYHGRFLEGFALKDCPTFEDWLLVKRENTALKQQWALRNLAEALETAGDWEEALAAFRRLLDLEPWDESAHRRVMVLLAAHDQRAGALAQFERCRKLLWDELGVKPEEETLKIYEQIRSGNFLGAHFALETHGSSGPAGEPQRAQFVGREGELERLHRALELAMSGQGQLIFISGEAGRGKTSLAKEFTRQALARYPGLLVAGGRCGAITGFDDPYLPFREIFQMLSGGSEVQSGIFLSPALRRRLNGAFPDTIKALLSSGAELIGPFISRDDLAGRIEAFDPEGQFWQQKLQQVRELPVQGGPGGSEPLNPNAAMTRMLGDLSRRWPLLLVIDDLQWADSGSIGLLYHLGKRLAGNHILILGAYRPQDLAHGRQRVGRSWERHPLEPVRLELQREFGDLEINLDQDQGYKLVEALVNREPNCLDDEFRQTLFRRTEGNPLFTVELLRAMQERGHLRKDSANRWVESGPFDWGKLPARVEAVIGERIGRLDPDQQDLLRAASVQGETFVGEVAALAAGLPEDHALAWLSGPLSREQGLVQALDVIRPASPAPCKIKRLTRYRFNHYLFQKYLINGADPAVRSALHERTGEALEACQSPLSLERALQLAWHFEEAGLPARAVVHLLAAGKQMEALGAYPQAGDLYERCLSLIERVPDRAERIRLEIQLLLARQGALLMTKGWGSPEAVRSVERAMALSGQIGADGAGPDQLVGLIFQADHSLAQNDIPHATRLLQTLRVVLRPDTERIYQVLVAYETGLVDLFAGHPVEALGSLERFMALYSEEDSARMADLLGYDPVLVGMAWLAFTHWILGNIRQSEAVRLAAIDLARARGSNRDLANILALVGAELAAVQNEIERTQAYAEEALQIHGTPTFNLGGVISRGVMGWVKVKLGQPEEGLAVLQGALDEWKAAGAHTMLPIHLMFMADALSLAGKSGEALAMVKTAKELIERSERAMFAAYLSWLEGEVLRRAGASGMTRPEPADAVAACYRRAIQKAQEQRVRSLELRAAASLAAWQKVHGQVREAWEILAPICGSFEGELEFWDLREARRLLEELRPATPPAD